MELELKRRENEQLKQQQAEMVQKIEKFNECEMGIAKAKATQNQLQLEQLDSKEQEQRKVISELNDKSFNVMR